MRKEARYGLPWSLEGIKAKPSKLKAQIEAIDKDIAALVAYVDSRNTAE